VRRSLNARRLLGVLALAFFGFVPFMGAYTSAPPVVIVYPLTVGSGANPESGSNIAVLLAQGLAQHGVTVKPAPPGTQRADYLTVAQAAGADYYVTGFLTALGDEVSMVLQAVSTSSGSIINSTTTVVKTYAEAAGQAPSLADAILRHSGRALAQLDEPKAVDSATPQPSRSDKGNEANLNGLGGIFHHKPKAAPSPGPGTLALAERRVLISQVGGDAGSELAQRASRAVTAAAGHGGVATQALPVSAAEVEAHGADFCKNNAGTQMLYATTVTLQKNAAGQPTGVGVDVVTFDCAGNAVARHHGEAPASGRGGLDAALDRAVAAALAAAAPKPG